MNGSQFQSWLHCEIIFCIIGSAFCWKEMRWEPKSHSVINSETEIGSKTVRELDGEMGEE